ncbi:hypothetical protein [Ruegeria arenilitoris]|uniref:hypothetical protein n=1 Tax=Ruegeria arenilitoris TaxID=1173585 RepID=UPI0014809093|nr:hypothetical protein [Ruegeria arenilitoris]
MTIYKFNIADGDPNTDTSKVNVKQPAQNTISNIPDAADVAAQQQRKYADYQTQNATTLKHLQERAVLRHEEERLQRELRRRNLSHKDIYG